MKFYYFEKTATNGTILLKNEVPIENISKIKFYSDNSSGIFSKKEFRWSFNKNYWSSWTTLTQNGISDITIRGNKYLYMEIRYIPVDNATISQFFIHYDQFAPSTLDPNQIIIPPPPDVSSLNNIGSKISDWHLYRPTNGDPTYYVGTWRKFVIFYIPENIS